VKDALGNELKIGDLVALQLERPLIFGQVVEASEGGIVTGINHKGGPEVRPGQIAILSKHTIAFDPRQLIGSVMALRDDNKRAEDIAGKPAESCEALPN